jgi:hypothetical protein
MKAALAALVLIGTMVAARGSLLFSDNFNYPNGCIETDGVWFCYTPATPHQDAFVTNDLLILNQDNYDGVAAPFNNSGGSSIIYASFNINVSALPTVKGGYLANFKDNTNDYVCHVFIATTNTVVPGTYQLGVDNFATSSSQAVWFPLDLATGITYQVVFSYDINNSDPLAGATLSVNPGSESDFDDSPAFAIDTTTNAGQQNISISQIGLSQYTDQGVATIGNLMIGTTYSDVVTNAALKPVIGIEPQGASIYSGDDVTLYVAASGTGQLSYQWLANGSPVASGTNVLILTDLQSSANYKVIVSNSAGSVTSDAAAISVNTTPTPPFFTTSPQGQTTTLGSTIQLTAAALGTGPLTYQWYFEATNTSTFNPIASGPTLSLTNVTFTQGGLYYVQVTGGDGNTNSAVVSVVVQPPPLVTIAYLHGLIASNAIPTSVFNVQGVVTSFAPLSASGRTYAECYIQDSTAGIYVYVGGQGSNNVPPAGALVSVTGPVQLYYSQLEIDPDVSGSAASNSISVLSYNNPLPQSIPLDLVSIESNPDRRVWKSGPVFAGDAHQRLPLQLGEWRAGEWNFSY